jgi:diguanylate cyclase (GGDEF)-like protein
VLKIGEAAGSVRGAGSVETDEFFEELPAGCHSLSADGRYLRVNRTEAGWLQRGPDEWRGRRYADFLTPDSAAAFDRAFRALRDGDEPIRALPLRLVRTDGSLCDIQLRAVACRDEVGRFLHSRGVTTRAEPSFAEAILDSSPDLIFAWDIPDGRAVYVNAVARALLGDLTLLPPRPGHLPLEAHLPEEDQPALRLLLRRVAAAHVGEPCEEEFRVRLAPRVHRWLRCRAVTLTYGADGVPRQVLFTAHDVTERREAEMVLVDHAREFKELTQKLASQQAELERTNARLSDLARTDGLTGLLNHAAFQDRLEREYLATRRYGNALSLALLDVDHFKQFNDAHGHPAGDVALKAVATALRATARETDAIARYGGEEFAIVLPDTTTREAAQIGERVRAAVAAIPNLPRRLTASVGIATLAPDAPDRATLVTAADHALYAAKRRGRDRVVIAE